MENLPSNEENSDILKSNARPIFLYIIYILILLSIPVGLANCFYEQYVDKFISGFQKFLNAFPEELIFLFGAAYLGYTGSRTYEKIKKCKNL